MEVDPQTNPCLRVNRMRRGYPILGERWSKSSVTPAENYMWLQGFQVTASKAAPVEIYTLGSITLSQLVVLSHF